jgi:hypothetical protein
MTTMTIYLAVSLTIAIIALVVMSVFAGIGIGKTRTFKALDREGAERAAGLYNPDKPPGRT